MNIKSRFIKFTIPILFLFSSIIFSVVFSHAQTAEFASPRQEKLLNGMNLLVWNAPDAAKVSVKLRIHSGSAFDVQGKEGTMALLADALFPTADAKEFFTEELGGSLDVTSNYDYIQINATANSDRFLTMLETLAVAVTNLQTDKETTAKVRAARLEKVKELEKNPSYIADQMVAKRLFGDFPYGRPQTGTSESIAKIDFADLTLAKQRFLTADNATLAVVGNVKSDLVYRAARRYFGAWTRADKKVPATFRQPDAPEAKEFSIELPNADKYSLRSAAIVAARGDKDFYATQILTAILQKRFCLNNESHPGKSAYQPFLLRGIYIVKTDIVYGKEELPINASGCPTSPQNLVKFDISPVKQIDFDTVKKAVIYDFQGKAETTWNLSEMWLDVDTFKLVSVKDEMSKLNNVTLADVQRIAGDLQKQPVVNVTVKKPESAKSN
ncbi:MAG TPA: pitrilysin family protein [Pyrinomonadaceae bacterium]|nr:pitrilysin family protein [Pyrinomonadaceae bacterium]